MRAQCWRTRGGCTAYLSRSKKHGMHASCTPQVLTSCTIYPLQHRYFQFSKYIQLQEMDCALFLEKKTMDGVGSCTKEQVFFAAVRSRVVWLTSHRAQLATGGSPCCIIYPSSPQFSEFSERSCSFQPMVLKGALLS